MSLRLYFSMIMAISATFAIASLGVLLVGELLGGFYLIPAIIFATLLILFQWISAPKIIEWSFRLVPAEKTEYAWVSDIVRSIAERSGLKKVPKTYVANISIANAFAYGNFLTGKKVAVTRGLLEILDRDEVEAVLAHEIGHVKHRDVEIMMALAVLPAIFYMIGRTLYYSMWFGGGSDEDKSAAILLLIAILSYILYFILSLFMLWVSRIREYYADEHSAKTVEGGNMKLASALVKLENYNYVTLKERREVNGSALAFKCLMISDFERSDVTPVTRIDEAVYMVARRRITFGDRLREIFSTHPLTPKRIRRLLRI